jgi:hypothetical protein
MHAEAARAKTSPSSKFSLQMSSVLPSKAAAILFLKPAGYA